MTPLESWLGSAFVAVVVLYGMPAMIAKVRDRIPPLLYLKKIT